MSKITKKAKAVIVIHEEFQSTRSITEYVCPTCKVNFRGASISLNVSRFMCSCGQLLDIKKHKIVPSKGGYRTDQDGTPKRVVVCAAIKMPDGLIICGARHFDKIMVDQIESNSVYGNKIPRPTPEQGFIDQFGEFLTREEALEIAKNTKQIIRRCGGDDNKLFSENLY